MKTKVLLSTMVVSVALFAGFVRSGHSFRIAPRAECPWCGYRTGGFTQFPMLYPYQAPWWAYYGAMSYPNFYYPGVWRGGYGGLTGSHYPGYGAVGIAKPNVYLSGPAGTRVQVKVKLAPDSHWLLASPAHGTEGWNGELDGNGSIRSGNVTYRNWFYDARVNENKLQDQAGFCVARNDLVGRLAAILANKGFKRSEVLDFEEHWQVKLPPAERLCVFPQDEEALDRIAPLEIQPAPKSVKRIVFLVTTPDELKVAQATGRFSREPVREWQTTNLQRTTASGEAGSGVELREWGVGFLMK